MVLVRAGMLTIVKALTALSIGLRASTFASLPTNTEGDLVKKRDSVMSNSQKQHKI